MSGCNHKINRPPTTVLSPSPTNENEPENIYHLFNIEILQTLEIVTSEENEGKPASVIKLRNMFSSCMDTDTMEADGIPQQLLHAAAWELGGWPAVIDNWGPEK